MCKLRMSNVTHAKVLNKKSLASGYKQSAKIVL